MPTLDANRLSYVEQRFSLLTSTPVPISDLVCPSPSTSLAVFPATAAWGSSNLSKASFAPMPASMPTKASSASKLWLPPTLTHSGPGHTPQRPQPMPKQIAPRTRRRSGIFPAVGGKSKLLAWRKALSCMPKPSTAWKYGKVISSAPPMTKARLTSQAPWATSRKEATLLGRAMPLITRPQPNVRPTTNSPSNVVTWSVVSSLRLSAQRHTAARQASTAARPAARAAPMYHSGTSASVCASGGNDFAASVRLAVTMPAAMKVGTATHERMLRRARPVRPCPEVHPCCIVEPRPTKNAPTPTLTKSSVLCSPLKKAGGCGSIPP
mmetsp:Transcript_162583/g.521216  ORF Transcript_162583/g.521216 Transcript_162583/m.521216 type:complete len:323 (+) Transcript_162583:218-1186(+)